MISMIWAMGKNRLIGRDNQLPWRLPADLANFKRITTGHPVIMGRKTFESLGRPLPGRKNVIITRNKDLSIEGCEILHSVEEACRLAEKQEVFIIGGAEIYSKFLPHADKLYITEIDESFEGDTHFPEFNMDEWVLTSKVKGDKDEKNPYDYYFLVYERKLKSL
ncbi:MAG: type 3 dihydrofolate reductase [Clostridia bacterium]|nr:type 3 dihydrofolate reductase [Clostridia bacterium]